MACALRTPPHGAAPDASGPRGARAARGRSRRQAPSPCSAVVDPEPAAGDFTRLCFARSGSAAELAVRMRVSRLAADPAVHAGRDEPGGQRIRGLARAVTRWTAAFIEETRLDNPSDPQDVSRERIREGSLFVWEDARPMSMAAWAGRAGSLVRVNYVYTPPEVRGRGYASACVASLTPAASDEGHASGLSLYRPRRIQRRSRSTRRSAIAQCARPRSIISVPANRRINLTRPTVSVVTWSRSPRRLRAVRWTDLGGPMPGDVSASAGWAGLRSLRLVLPTARSVDEAWGHS